MSAPRVHFGAAPQLPSYSPPPAYAAHNFDGLMTFAQKERMASLAENKLTYLVSQRKREPSLRHVLLHAGFLERVLDSIDATTPEQLADEPMIEEEPVKEVPAPAYEIHQALSTIVEVDDEMEVDDEEEEEEEDEDMPVLTRTISHRPGSPVSSDDEEEQEEESDDEELPSPPPKYTAAPDHPLFNLFEVREKARREELSNQYRIEHETQQNIFFLNNPIAVAA
jgi:hypothetical protein